MQIPENLFGRFRESILSTSFLFFAIVHVPGAVRNAQQAIVKDHFIAQILQTAASSAMLHAQIETANHFRVTPFRDTSLAPAVFHTSVVAIYGSEWTPFRRTHWISSTSFAGHRVHGSFFRIGA